MSLVSIVRKTSERIKDVTVQNSFNQAVSELGELATEVDIKYGGSYKKEGEDGIIGESVDAIIALLDVIYREDPSITEEDLILIAARKCAKWESKVAGKDPASV